MVERYHLQKDCIESSRAAIIAAEDNDAVVSMDDDTIRVKFEDAPLELDYLIRHQGFKTHPQTASADHIHLYKRK